MVVPYGCIHIGYSDYAGGDAGVVAGVTAGRRRLPVVQDLRGISLRKVGFHIVEQRGVAGGVEGVSHCIPVKCALLGSQRGAYLRRSLYPGFQALVVCPSKGEHLGRTCRPSRRACDLQGDLRDDLAPERRSRIIEHHHAHAGFGRCCSLISALAGAVGRARVP